MTELGFKIPADLVPGALAPNSHTVLYLTLFDLVFENWEISYQNLESWLILADQKNWGHGCISLRLMPTQAGCLGPHVIPVPTVHASSDSEFLRT